MSSIESKTGSLLAPKMDGGEESQKQSSELREEIRDGLHAAVEVAPGCNLNCPHCYSQTLTESLFKWPKDISEGVQSKLPDDFLKFHLTTKKLERMFENFEKTGIGNVAISGGEPTLNPDIVEFVQEAKRHNIKTHLSTHGMYLLDKQRRDLGYYGGKKVLLAEQLREAGLDVLTVSFDAPTPEVNNAIRLQRLDDKPSDHYEKVIEVLEWYGKQWQEAQEKGEKIFTLRINTVVMQANLEQIPDMGKLLSQYIPKEARARLKIIQVIPRGAGKENQDTLLVNDEDFMRVAEETQRKYGDHLDVAVRPYDAKEEYAMIIVGYNGNCSIPKGEEHPPMMVETETGERTSEIVNALDPDFPSHINNRILNDSSFIDRNRSTLSYDQRE